MTLLWQWPILLALEAQFYRLLIGPLLKLLVIEEAMAAAQVTS